MIKIENAVFSSPEQMRAIIMGMRNPMNSWEKSDTTFNSQMEMVFDDNGNASVSDACDITVGDNDYALMLKLAKAGKDHRKYLRMMSVIVDVTAPLYFYKEMDTYKIGTVANSCSTMHKIPEKPFVVDDFSTEHLTEMSLQYLKTGTIHLLNQYRDLYLNGGSDIGYSQVKTYEPKDKECWWQMIQMLPSSYNQKRTLMISYEALANMYHARKNHKLDEWREFCKWIETIPYSELITLD